MSESDDGGSRFTHVEEIEPLTTGESRYWPVWGWDSPPNLSAGSTQRYLPRSVFPPRGGLRIYVSRMVEGDDLGSAAGDGDPGFSELVAAEPAGVVVDPDRPGMHRTDTFDVGFVISGSITVEAMDGSQTILGPGDVYIQNGSFHAWRRNSEDPAEVLFFILGETRRS